MMLHFQNNYKPNKKIMTFLQDKLPSQDNVTLCDRPYNIKYKKALYIHITDEKCKESKTGT